jgi:hypothetical protein
MSQRVVPHYFLYWRFYRRRWRCWRSEHRLDCAYSRTGIHMIMADNMSAPFYLTARLRYFVALLIRRRQFQQEISTLSGEPDSTFPRLIPPMPMIAIGYVLSYGRAKANASIYSIKHWL